MNKKIFKKISADITSKFFAGLIVILPVFLSIVIMLFLLDKLDSILGKYIREYFNISIPGLGLITLLVGIWFTGLITTNYFGRGIVNIYEKIISKIPIVRTIFRGIKQISDGLFSGKSKSFEQVVLVYYPFYGIYAMGFMTSSEIVRLKTSKQNNDIVHVFMPTTPNPTSGYLILVPIKQITLLNLSVEDGLKAVISMGVIHPPEYLQRKPGEKITRTLEPKTVPKKQKKKKRYYAPKKRMARKT